LGRSRRSKLALYEWLLLGLGLSTFSWEVLCAFVAWMYLLSWRGEVRSEGLRNWQFNLMQVALGLFSLYTLISLVAVIPSGLLGSPDMRIDNGYTGSDMLSWFNDRSDGKLDPPWIFSVSIWWYKVAMLLWALWLAFALTRWVPYAWNALTVGGVWRRPPSKPKAPEAPIAPAG
jgi:hypothetical protein